MQITVNKIWNGFATVRSMDVERCVKSRTNLHIRYKTEEMIVPLSKLQHPLSLVKRKFKSQFDGKPYYLYDFLWVPKKVEEQTNKQKLF